MYLNTFNVMKAFAQTGCYVYGTGNDARLFFDTFSSNMDICGFIVSITNESMFLGKPVYDKTVCCRDDIRGRIIIATRKYSEEVCALLDKMGLVPGKDFYIWDNNGIYDIDLATQRLIDWNKNTWTENKRWGEKRKVLIPIESSYDCNVIYYAYIADFLNNKYNAEIECYIRNDNQDVYDGIKKIYRSFGVEKIVYQSLTDKQEKMADDIFEIEWNKIRTFEDWNRITIFGISFGTTIIRSYLRFKELDIDPRSDSFKKHLFECIRTIIFWHDRFDSFDYKMVIMWDGAHWEGFIRDIAISKGIKAYALNYRYGVRLEYNYATQGRQHMFYKAFWNSLSDVEKREGIEWAKKKLHTRLQGESKDDIEVIRGRDPYTVELKEKVLDDNNRIKVMIAMHIFGEDSYPYGDQIFDNNYISWLTHLGDLSIKLNKYDWYIKLHPHGDIRDERFVDKYIKKYPNIKRIDGMISPVQLKEEGLDFALDVHGTIGAEYPLLGIQVINAGANPHMAFEFDWNPRDKDEYDNMICNLDKMNNLDKAEEVYEFYAIHRLLYNHMARKGKPFFENFENKEIGMWNDDLKRYCYEKEVGTWKFSAFLDEINNDKHIELCNRIAEELDILDKWETFVFYKK